MKAALEEERRALLAKIEASRADYRRMFSSQSRQWEHGKTMSVNDAADSKNALPDGSPGFPHSRTVKWVMDHPLIVAAGVAILVWNIPRLISARTKIRAQKKRQSEREQTRENIRANKEEHGYESAPREGTARALMTAAALLLRNPTTLRTVAHAAGAAWKWMQEGRKPHAHAPVISRRVH